ncbi:Ig-like domain-containing protein [Aquabacterium sp.]|uniref:Ig-like domain-containing protein n=1 Tax=Aquabacterium sp. TaxID=1872578 RepID=UPI0035AF2157
MSAVLSITGLTKATDTGTSTTDGVTKSTKPALYGTYDGGSGITIQLYYLDGTGTPKVIGSGTVSATGTWTITSTTALTAGTYDIFARTSDSSTISAEAYPVKIDLSAAAPTVSLTTDTYGVISFDGSDTNVGTGSDLITKSTLPTVSGTGEVGATVTLYKGSVVMGTATVGSDGTWTTALTTALTSGVNTLTAKQVDLAGNTSGAATLKVTVDTTAAAPTTLALNKTTNSGLTTDLITNFSKGAAITGKGEAGAVVEVLDGDTVIGIATVSTKGTWTVTLPDDLDDGSHVLTARQTDKAGNTSGLSTSITVTIDTTADSPDAPILASASDTGRYNDDGITNNTKPTFTGSGLSAGAKVEIWLDTNNDGTPDKSIGSSTVASDGSWTFTPKAAIGSGSYTVYAKVTDVAGNVSGWSEGTSLTVNKTTLAALTTVDLITAADSAGPNGTAVDNLTADNHPTFSGTGAAANAEIKLFIDTNGNGKLDSTETTLGTTIAESDGTWSYTTETELVDGSYKISAIQTDVAGNVSTKGSKALTVTIDTTVAAPTALALTAASDTGSSTTDGITKNNLPTLTGKGEVGAQVKVYEDDTLLGTATVGTTGTWSLTLTSALSDGEHQIYAYQVDKAGNVSEDSSTLTVTVDTSEDKPATPDLDESSDTGTNTEDNITADTTPTFSGSDVSVGAKVELFNDKDGDGVLDTGELLGSATADSNGDWSITTGTLAGGTYSVKARVTDTAGNVSAASDALSVTIKTAKPATLTALDLATASDSAAAKIGTTSDNYTNQTNVTVSGASAEAGNTIKVFDDKDGDGVLDTGELLATTSVAAAGAWSVSIEGLSAGTHSIKAIQLDDFGQTSTASAALSVTVDTTADSTPAAADLATASDSAGAGTAGTTTDNLTNVTKPTFTGTAIAGEQVNIYIDGADTPAGQVVASSTGAWTWTATTALTPGEHTIVVTQTDKAGNESASSAELTITVDTAEAAPSKPDLTIASDSGSVTDDNITAVTTPTFTGTAGKGDKVELFKDTNNNGTLDSGELLGSATADADGNWSITSSALTGGTYSIKARATDAAGNVSIASDAVSVIIKTAKPATLTALDLAAADDTAGAKIGSSTDNYTSKTTVTISGATAEAGNTIKVFDDKDSDGVLDDGELLGSVSGASAGAWSIQLEDLAAGTHSIKAIQVDDFGQTSVASTALSLTIDTTADSAPAAADLATASDSAAGTGTTADNLTNVTKPTFTGTAIAGEQVNIYIDGADTPAGQVVASSTGAWTWTATTALTSGEHEITVTQTDKAGNESSSSSALTIKVDTTPPATSTPDLAASSDAGTSDHDNTTNVAKPTFTGTVSAEEAGAKVEVFRDADGDGVIDSGESLGTTTVGSDGSWSLTASTALTAGANNIKTIVTDKAGNVSSASAALAVTLDTTLPTVSGTPTVNGNTLTFTTSEALDATHLPAASTFTVKVGGTAVEVSGVAVSGSTVTLTLASEVAIGATVTLGYTDATSADDTSGVVQDTAGNDLATFTGKTVTNLTPSDSKAPTLSSASVNGDKLTLTYNEALDASHIPSVSYFTVLVNGDQRTVTYAAVSGSSLVLTLAKSVSADDTNITVTYADPSSSNDTYAVQDSAGNDAAALTTQAVTNATSSSGTDTASPELVNSSLDTSTKTLTLTFNETVSLGAGNPAVYILHDGGTSTVASFSSASANGHTVTLGINATLASTDSVILLVGGNTVKDASNNYVPECSVVVGGSAANNVDLASYTGTLFYPVIVRTNGGNDTIVGSGAEEDTLVGGGGSDYINGSWGGDEIYVTEKAGSKASDTISFLVKDSEDGAYSYAASDSGDYWVGSTVDNTDVVFGFDVTDASTSSNTNDKLVMVSNTIAADKTATSGTAVGSFAKYAITSGIVTLMNSSGTAITVNSNNYEQAITFLAGVLKAGDTVGIAVDSGDTPDGLIDSTAIYQHLDTSGGTDGDILTLLKGVTGVTLGTSAGQNVVQIVDDAPPEINDATLGTNTLTLKLNEVVTGSSGFSAYVNNAGTGTNVLNNVSGATTNTLTLNLSKTLTSTDWLLVKYDTSAGTVADATGNKMGAIMSDAGIAIGGSGNTTIDLSTTSANFAIADIGGGNDTLTGGSGDNSIEGGKGNDSIIGGAGADTITGGAGVDTMTGGTGADTFIFEQGDSTTGTFTDKDSSSTVSNGDTYNFSTNGVDVITDLKDAGDTLKLNSDGATGFSEYLAGGKTLTDQTYRLVAGNYNTSTKVFTVNSSGSDTLVVYDGDSSTSVSETAVVLKGTSLSTLDYSQYSNEISVQVAPSISSASFSTDTSGATTLSVVFSDVITSNTLTTAILAGYDASTSKWVSLTVTGYSWSSDGTTLNITTSSAFDTTKGLVVETGGAVVSTGGSLDLTGSLVVGSGTADTINASSINSNLDSSFGNGLWYPVKVMANGGADSIVGSDSADTLVGGGGQDTINGGWGADKIQLKESTAASDTVQLLVPEDNSFWTGSSIEQTDVIYNFDVSGTSTNDKLELASSTVAATTTSGNGTDVGVFATHTIASGGVVTLKNSSGSEVYVTAANKADALTYLAGVLTAGDTAALHYDFDGDGTADSTLVYQHLDASGGTDGDVVTVLYGVTGATLGTSAAANMIQITDTWAPDVRDASLASTSLTLKMSEKLASTTDITGFSAYLNGDGTNIVSSVSTTANQLQINFSSSLTAGDWVMFNHTGSLVTDLNSHIWNFASAGAAIAYSGDTTIDLSGTSANYELIDLSGGNGTLTGGSGDNYMEGNDGDDVLSGNDGSDNMEGGDGDDALDGGDGDDHLLGGADADDLTGGAGADTFVFNQGDSTAVAFADNGTVGVNTGDTFTFTGGSADVITDFSDVGDTIQLNSSNGMQSQTGSFTGIVGDQKYAVVVGSYNATSHVFTVDTATGTDSLLVYDGSEATGTVTQTAVVLVGVTQVNDHSYGNLEVLTS